MDVAHLLQYTGEPDLANLLLDRCLNFMTSNVFAANSNRFLVEAKAHAVRGDWPRALDALERAVDQGWRKLTWYYFGHDTVFEPFRDKPESQALVNRVNSDLAAQLTRVREMESTGEFQTTP